MKTPPLASVTIPWDECPKRTHCDGCGKKLDNNNLPIRSWIPYNVPDAERRWIVTCRKYGCEIAAMSKDDARQLELFT